MSALKWIIAEAKKIKKQYPKRFKTWTEYVKQASAIYATKHKSKSPVGKKHKVGAVKKTATKKPKVKTVETAHKDTKSHNVNIRVVSGTPRKHFIDKQSDILEKIKLLVKYNNDIENLLLTWKSRIKNDKSEPFVKLQKKHVQNNIKNYTSLLKSNKKYLTELKKHVK